MKIPLRRAIVPFYLFVCLIIGGSAQGVWTNLALQLLAVAIIGWALAARRSNEWSSGARWLIGLLAATVVLIALQLIPLPAGLWTSLPGRGPIAANYQLLGYSLPSLPVSLAPYSGVAALLATLPAIAVLLAGIHAWQRQGVIATALLLGAFAGVLLGALQATSAGPESSFWYLYPVTNHGAVGFFANGNHMGSLFLVCIPFALAILGSSASRGHRASSAASMTVLGIAGLLVVASGLVLNRSLAALGIAVPVLLFSALLLPGGWKFRKLALPVGGVALLGALLYLSRTPVSATPGSELESVQSRAEVWTRTAEIIGQYFPAGSGFGSFSSVYRMAEDPALVGLKHVNHAHNDYLELLLELGLVGAILLALFLGWWLVQTVRVWRSGLSSYYARAATIASGALLAHSLVDYPLRTAALSSVFAMCLALMAQPRPPKHGHDEDAPSAKHVAIG